MDRSKRCTFLEKGLSRVGMFLFLLLLGQPSGANPALTYQGRLLSPDGTPVQASVVHFRVQIRSPLPSDCLMYEAAYSRNMTGSGGLFSISINGETPSTPNSEPFAFHQIFKNQGELNFVAGKCGSGTSYEPDEDDPRVLAVFFNIPTVFTGWEPLPRVNVNYVPLAMEAISVGGFKAAELFRVETPAHVPVVLAPWSQANYQKLLDLITNVNVTGGVVSVGGSSATFTGSLSGDVTGTQSATSVVRLQGRNVAATAPGNGDVLTWNQAATRWEAAAPTGGGGGGTLGSLNGSSEATQTFATGTTGTNFGISTNTGTGVHTFNLPDASASARGALTSADWSTFNSKLGASLADGTIWIGNSGGTATARTLTGAITVDNAGATSYSGTVPLNRGGTGQTTKTAAFNALSPLTTKGDLAAHDGTDSVRLPAGTNNYLLTANSSTASGLEWRALAAGDLPSFTANRLIGTSAGGALQVVSCGLNQVVSFDGAGNMTCASAGSGNVSNGGNSFSGAMTIGTNDAFALNFETSGSNRMTIDASGNVGIGTGAATPAYLLSLGGSAAQTIGMNRNPTGNSDGNHLTIQAGGASAGATDKQGGNLVLSAGMSTGAAQSGSISFQAPYWNGGGNTADQDFLTLLKVGRHWTGTPHMSLGTYTDYELYAPFVVAFDGNTSLTYASTAAAQFLGSTDVPGVRISNRSWANNSFAFTEYEVSNGNGNGQFSYIASVANSGAGAFTPDMVFGVSTSAAARAERMRIKADGNVGIGTNDPQAKLDVVGKIHAQELCDEAGNNCKDISTGWGGTGDISNGGNSGAVTIGTNTNHALSFETNGTTRMTIASTGEVQLTRSLRLPDGDDSTPSLSFSSGTNTGFYSQGFGAAIGVTSNGAEVMNISNDAIETYRRYRVFEGNQGATEPGFSFSADTNTGMYHINSDRLGFSVGGTGILEISSAGVLPVTTATGSVGSSTQRWATGYFSGAIDTSSDVRLKKDIEETDLGLDFVLDLKPVSWHWKQGKGDSTRHYGFIAQDAEKIIRKHSAYPEKNLIVNHDKESDTYGIRYSELISPIIKALQELYARVVGTESRQEALKAEIAELRQENRNAAAKLHEMEANYKRLLDKVEALEKK